MLLRSTGPLLEASAASTSRLNARLSVPIRGLAQLQKASLSSAATTEDLEVLERNGKKPWTDHKISRHGEERKDLALLRRARGTVIPREKKHSTPYELSQSVKALCKEGQLVKAVTIVKEAYWDAQNNIVWGTLIHEFMQARKYKEAYRLFTDMKRRGFVPTGRTYGTMLAGYAQIEDWNRYPSQLQNVYSLYDQLKQHHADVIQRLGPRSSELSSIPYTALIRIFGQAQQFQRMFDIFNGMPSDGPLAPNLYTFTTLLDAIGNRKLSALPSSSPGTQEHDGGLNPPTYNELLSKNASDARLVWRQLLRASAKTPGFDIDSHALRALLKILARGRPSDQNFAFDIIHEYLGLSQPGQTAISPKVELHGAILESILHACNNAKRYNLTLHYVQQIIDSESESRNGKGWPDARRILNRRHMDLVLEARAALSSLGASGEAEQSLETLEWMLRMHAMAQAAGKQRGDSFLIAPGASTYEFVALACWRSADWKSVCRTFELMTGHHADHFRGEVCKPPVQDQRSPGRALVPTAAFMSSFIRTAHKTRQTENMLQAVNTFQYYGWDTFFHPDHPGKGLSASTSRKQEKDLAFYSSKLASALMDVLPALLELLSINAATKATLGALWRRAKGTVGLSPPRGDGSPVARQRVLSGAYVDTAHETRTRQPSNVAHGPPGPPGRRHQHTETAGRDTARDLAPYNPKSTRNRTNDKWVSKC